MDDNEATTTFFNGSGGSGTSDTSSIPHDHAKNAKNKNKSKHINDNSSVGSYHKKGTYFHLRNRQHTPPPKTPSTVPLMGMILVSGALAASLFMYVGINGLHQAEKEEFAGAARDTLGYIADAFEDYVDAGRLVHTMCRHNDVSRRDFTEIHESLVQSGLTYKAVQWTPNVTHAERPAYEAKNRLYYETNYPYVSYQGIRGFNTLDGKDGLQPRFAMPYYFPIDHMEPIKGNEAAIDLDYHSSEMRIRATNALFQTRGPSLSDRLALVKKKGEKSRCGNYDVAAYGVVLINPGVEVTNPQPGDHTWPKDFSSIVLCIPDLLLRATKKHIHKSMDVYIHDQSTPTAISTAPVFMGGIRVESLSSSSSTNNAGTNNGGGNGTNQDNDRMKNITILDEISFEELTRNCATSSYKFQNNVQVSNRVWTVTVVALEGAYEPAIGLTVFGGSIMFVVFACVAAWLYTNERRVAQYNRLKGKADAEQHLLHNKIQIQDRIVSNMIPAEIRDKIYQGAQHEQQQQQQLESTRSSSNSKRRKRNSLKVSYDGKHSNNDGMEAVLEDDEMKGMEEGLPFSANGPLAELYPSATIIFADICGFTAWSSTREPPQVFMLLERIFSRWDKIAKRHDVFKVETVGDCYVGASGLPTKRDNHVVVIARFAREILDDFEALVNKLEVKLGPDTSELMIRIGIHTGQVTAGLLRGDRARYQLFGDTVNTTARVQTTSKKGRIQVSHTSALLLRSFGKGKWLIPRPGLVGVKGKGDMQMFWLTPKKGFPIPTESLTQRFDNDDQQSECMTYKTDGNQSSLSSYADDDWEGNDDNDSDSGSFCFGLASQKRAVDLSKMERLVKWNAEILCELLLHILAARQNNNSNNNNHFDNHNHNNNNKHCETQPDKGNNKDEKHKIRDVECSIGIGKHGDRCTVLEEFQDIVALPRVGLEDLKRRKDPKKILLDPKIKGQLEHYLSTIAGMYQHNNHFHNFEHATHVTASVRKLLSRIVKVDNMVNKERELNDLVGHSYGITSDPLTQFTVVLSAVIHDVDHPGVPNNRLVEEGTREAIYYKGKSIAEQNSVDLSWRLLMQPKYAELRSCIYSNTEELHRFRQLLVNVVMATDIADKQLALARKDRWAVAFAEQPPPSTTTNSNSFSSSVIGKSLDIDMNRKATIVLEHLIQASDVCHTMQHWNIFHSWNEKLFFEMYSTYKAGRSNVDPLIGWYQGEIGFFDFYIIPLAKKLDKCGVFGVSSHEYLDYAKSNRDEWARRGHECVEAYLQKYQEMEAAMKEATTRQPIFEIDEDLSL